MASMIVGGARSGLSRAADHSLSYACWYGVAGIPLVSLIGLIWGATEYGNFTVAMVCLHLFSIIVVLPAAVAMNFVALRVFRSRSWRREPWRAWVAGVLGVPLVWGGPFVWMKIEGRPPAFIEQVGPLGATAYILGIIIFFSNLAVLIAWLLPSRKSTAGG